MATFLPPIPATQPQPEVSPYATPMGGLVPPGSEAPREDAQEAQRAVMRRIREVSATVEALARQFPPFAEHARTVLDALKDGMVAIVSDLNRVEESPPAPRVLG